MQDREDFRHYFCIARGRVAELGSWYVILGALGSIDDARLPWLQAGVTTWAGRSVAPLLDSLAGHSPAGR